MFIYIQKITKFNSIISNFDKIMPHKARDTTGRAKKAGPQTHDHNSVKSHRLKNYSGRFLGKFAVKGILKIPPRLAYVATLPCETLMSAKQALNDKLQDSVATYWYLWCGGVVNNQIKKGLLLSLRVKIKIKSVNIWQSYQQKHDCLVHFLRLLAVCWLGAQTTGDNHAR